MVGGRGWKGAGAGGGGCVEEVWCAIRPRQGCYHPATGRAIQLCRRQWKYHPLAVEAGAGAAAAAGGGTYRRAVDILAVDVFAVDVRRCRRRRRRGGGSGGGGARRVDIIVPPRGDRWVCCSVGAASRAAPPDEAKRGGGARSSRREIPTTRAVDLAHRELAEGSDRTRASRAAAADDEDEEEEDEVAGGGGACSSTIGSPSTSESVSGRRRRRRRAARRAAPRRCRAPTPARAWRCTTAGRATTRPTRAAAALQMSAAPCGSRGSAAGMDGSEIVGSVASKAVR